jgi:hypothetical protein
VDIHKIWRKRLKDGFCALENKAYVGFTLFRILTFKKTGIPDDEQKSCPLYVDSSSEKRIPTAGSVIFKRVTDLRDQDNKLLDGKYIYFTLSTAKNPNQVSETSYTLTGTVNGSMKLLGSAHVSVSVSGQSKTVSLKGEISLDVGDMGRSSIVVLQFEITGREGTQAQIIDQKYVLDKKEIAGKELESAFPILFYMFEWNWPNQGLA